MKGRGCLVSGLIYPMPKKWNKIISEIFIIKFGIKLIFNLGINLLIATLFLDQTTS